MRGLLLVVSVGCLTCATRAQDGWRSEDLPDRVRRWIVEKEPATERVEPRMRSMPIAPRSTDGKDVGERTTGLDVSMPRLLYGMALGVGVAFLVGALLAFVRQRSTSSRTLDEETAYPRELFKRALALREDPEAILLACHGAAIALAARVSSQRVGTTTDGRLAPGFLERERPSFSAITDTFGGVRYGRGSIDSEGAERVRCWLVTLFHDNLSASGDPERSGQG